MNFKMRFVLIFTMVFLLVGAKVYTQTVSYTDAVDKIALDIEAKINGNTPVAILKFDSSSQLFSDHIMDDLIEKLINNEVKVVDRKNLEDILTEQKLQISGNVSDESAVSIGHMLGAKSIIIGSGKNMVDYYRVQFKMLSVETTAIQSSISQNISYDSTLRRLLGNSEPDGIGSTRFAVGGRLGVGFQFNTADENMVGAGLSPNEKSNIAFDATMYGAFRFSDKWVIQPEINFMVNNGMEMSGHGYTYKIAYNTIDIPILIRWNFNQAPNVVGILVGPYISLPLSKLNMTFDGKGSALDTGGYTFGITGGLSAGFKAGPGHLVLDARLLIDFRSLYVYEDFGDGEEKANICIRRSLNISLGYEFSL